MSFRGIATAVVGLSLFAAPVFAAEAAPTAPVSSSARAGVDTNSQSNMQGLGGGGWIIAIPAAVAVALGVYFATKHHRTRPVSS